MQPTELVPYVIAGVAVAIFLGASFVTVAQGSIAVITMFGKYRRIMTPGLNWRLPVLEAIYRRVSIQNQSIELQFQAITADQANVNFKAMLLYAVMNQDEATIKNVAFKFIDLQSLMQALVRTVEGSVRSFVATKKQSEILLLRRDIVEAVKEQLDQSLASWGYHLIDLQMNDISFDEEIMRSMARVVASNNLKATLAGLSHRDAHEAVDLLADVRRGVLVLGGRVSAPLARYLAAQLHLLRPGIALVDAERSTPAQQLIDMRKSDVLVVFDFRRYQADTIESARVASAKGSHVILFTDPWLSPASAYARQVIITSVDTVGPFDSLVGATAVVEAVVATVLSRLGPRAQARMQTLERLRAGDVLAGDEPRG